MHLLTVRHVTLTGLTWWSPSRSRSCGTLSRAPCAPAPPWGRPWRCPPRAAEAGTRAQAQRGSRANGETAQGILKCGDSEHSALWLVVGRHPPDGVLKLFVGPRPGKCPGEKEPGWKGGWWWGYPDIPGIPDKPISGLGSSGAGGKLVMVSQVGEGLMSSSHVTCHVCHGEMSRKSRVVTAQTQFDSDQAPVRILI